MLKIWGRRTSSNVQTVMWCVGELGLDHERYDYGHRFGGTDSDAFYAMNPNRTVPVIQDGDAAPLWESGCILRYLATRYGAGPFWPSELDARTEVDRWAEWSKVTVAPSFSRPVFWQLVRTPAAERDPVAIARGLKAYEQKLAIADERLARHPYLVGDDFTLADIPFGHLLFRYYDIDIERARLDHLAAYYARLKQRPMFREHVMVSYDDLRA